MLAARLAAESGTFLQPEASFWSRVAGEVVRLIPTPLGLQPSAYIAASRQNEPPGRVREAQVQAAHNGRELALRLTWHDPEPDRAVVDTGSFPDGAALLFPLLGDAPLATMGSPEQPVSAWHWRADREGFARSNLATGLGTTEVVSEREVRTAAVWSDGRWRVVFVRALELARPTDRAIRFRAGEAVRVAVAVWEGSNGERAGLKSFSPEWHWLRLQG